MIGKTILALTAAIAAIVTASQDVVVHPRLREGGEVYLKNDLQAAGDAMMVFRQFRREFRGQLDEFFEEVDSEDEASLVAVLSADPDVLETFGIINEGIPYPSGYMTSKVMFLAIYEVGSDRLLWFDAVDWESRGLATQLDSHEKLVRRLKGALEQQ